jgi:hypothetical protein
MLLMVAQGIVVPVVPLLRLRSAHGSEMKMRRRKQNDNK